ncbi:rod shape-determining protein MreD [Chamaesiphon sp.]|uniref:rod shape-determining protein MreD n=1 Tax=Chamaesiphon sp. TaxID=2814140 RepID=UPI0035936D98
MNITNLHPLARTGLVVLTVVGSVGLCLILSPTRWPGMEILGVGPSWLVMWTIAWSLQRSLWHAATAGVVLGLIQDAMTFPAATTLGTMPTHVLSLTTVGVLTFWLYKRRYLDDTILSVSIGTFLLTLVSETITGLQYFIEVAIEQSLETSIDSFGYIWANQSSVILISAILSGLWMPILYYPLHLWWQRIGANNKLT